MPDNRVSAVFSRWLPEKEFHRKLLIMMKASRHIFQKTLLTILMPYDIYVVIAWLRQPLCSEPKYRCINALTQILVTDVNTFSVKVANIQGKGTWFQATLNKFWSRLGSVFIFSVTKCIQDLVNYVKYDIPAP